MFKTITCIIPVCDKCERNAEDGGDFLPHYSTEAEARDCLEDSECYEINGELLCPSCWEYDDEGERVKSV